jgi:hypothetical protein
MQEKLQRLRLLIKAQTLLVKMEKDPKRKALIRENVKRLKERLKEEEGKEQANGL